ncbi:MAG: trypsin-like peptidase domain-containing protein [bacterium]
MRKHKLFLTLGLVGFLSLGAMAIGTAPIPSIFGPETIADIVESEGNAVVNIDVVKKIKVSSPFHGFEGFGFEFAPEFKDFFQERVVPRKGAGSGFIIDKKGLILTNEHVIRGVDEIKVTLRDGKKFNGKVIGQDANLDVAIIKIETNGVDLPVLPLGDSAKIRPGQWVIAIGNPYGFSNTVTSGIVSATGRSLGDLGKKNLIQIDAAINPGNSGGPLLNLKGEVIGLNVAIVAGAQGIGFAIPINAAKEIMGDLISKGKVIRPWLGIFMRDVDERIASYLDLPIAEGIVITDVAKDSPAEKMGLKKYDVVRELNGAKVAKSSDLSDLVGKAKVGDKIRLKVYREGKLLVLNGKLEQRP